MKYKLLGACAAALCCAAPAFAQGLTRVEVLGLQQQLRDDGCGITHTTGRLDAATRAAVKQCQSKYSGATDAKSMLAAMKIGFENGETVPTLASARTGGGSMSAGGISGSTIGSASDTAAKGTANLNMATPIKMTRPITPMDSSTTNVDTSTARDATSKAADTFPKRDTIPSRDTLPRRDTMPTMPTMPRRDTLPRRDTMPKPDTAHHSTHVRI